MGDDHPSSRDDGNDTRRTGRQSENQPYEIPPEGSLGLLALGAVGITEWRYARERARKAAEAAAASEPDSETDEDPGDEHE